MDEYEGLPNDDELEPGPISSTYDYVSRSIGNCFITVTNTHRESPDDEWCDTDIFFRDIEQNISITVVVNNGNVDYDGYRIIDGKYITMSNEDMAASINTILSKFGYGDLDSFILSDDYNDIIDGNIPTGWEIFYDE